MANAAQYFLTRHAEGALGAKIAFREIGADGRAMTYAELDAAADQAVGMLADLGLRREDRIACLVLDQIEYPVLFFGALKAGVVPVLLNTLLAAGVYETILADCRARALFVSEALYPVVAPVLAGLPELKTVVVIGEAPEGTLSYADAFAVAAPGAMIEASDDETAFWLYSSGSTGRPKGVRHVHGSMKATADTYGAQVLGIEEGDIVYSAAKIFFAYGLGNAVTFPMAVGATTILNPGRPTPDGVAEILASHKPTIFCGVPTLYAAMVAHMESAGAPDAPLRRCISAGEALPAEVGRRWEALTGCEILDGVGSTEMLHIFLSNAPGDVDYGTSGVAVPGYDLRLVDETDTEVGVGEIGELLVRGVSAADGYWNQREKSRATFMGEWTRTGDKYERRADGRLIYCGRTDDMFKVSGIWLSPFEVESALAAHPAVLESAVVARQDDDGLEKPVAFVVLREGEGSDALAEELKAHVKEAAGLWKYPRWIEFREDLPKTATGKIQRFKLRGDA